MDGTLSEVYPVLTPGGFFQFSISHPCFDTPYRWNVRNERGRTYAIEVGDYFREIEGESIEWIFSSVPPEERKNLPKFKAPRFHRTLSKWLNLVIEAGFQIESLGEPCPSDEAVRACPHVQDAQVAAYFLHVRTHQDGGLDERRPRRLPFLGTPR